MCYQVEIQVSKQIWGDFPGFLFICNKAVCGVKTYEGVQYVIFIFSKQAFNESFEFRNRLKPHEPHKI